jgi:putative hydrolase of the HAD superfamily
VETIFFDLGNVLIHYSEERLHRQLSKAFQVEDKELRGHIFKQEQRLSYERGELTTQEFCEDLLQRANKKIPQEDIIHALTNIFWQNHSIAPIVTALKKKGFRLVLLSNISEIHHNYIERNFDVLDWFDDFIMSYKVGSVKPDNGIFQAALSIANCSAEHCFYTDDIPEFIEAARKHNIDAEQYTSTPSLESHLSKRGVLFD